MMRKILWVGVSMATFAFSGGAMAAAKASKLGDTTWNLTGAYNVSYAFSCKVGGQGAGRKKVKLPGQANLGLSVQFNPDKTFTITGDTLGLGVFAGDWKGKGRNLSFMVDDQNDSYIFQQSKVFQDETKQLSGSGSAGGASYNYKFSPVKYAFVGSLNPKGNTLKLRESATFKVTASASYAGHSNTCSYHWTVAREYSGGQAQ
ncbi:hypothetical protein SAMN02949497_0906 [Methylomagnum ishizawai]|uniref:Uncharacterized protein n=2 Tax=Methylomagnum ishizawai TaxID=1760988 RepID=A0A1Y6CSM3_9GAMM|nr:hypothetical protein SAMN02949497_0906 [Methylomagnum ishizawai]